MRQVTKMKGTEILGVICLLYVILAPEVRASSILVIFPHIGKSHFFVFEPYLKQLAARGHEVHVISHFPQTKQIPNYYDISVKGSIQNFEPTGNVTFDMFGKSAPRILSPYVTTNILGNMGAFTCEVVLSYPSVQQLLQSDMKFDLIMTELFNTDCFLGFSHKFKAPHMALSSCTLMPWAGDRFGNPDHPAYIPNLLSTFGDHMTFLERLENTIMNILVRPITYYTISRPAQQIATKYFGESMPLIDDMMRNTSLVLVNTHPTLNRPRPLLPNVIDVGGIHVGPAKKLSKDLDQWLSDAEHGVIFFSMGSMIRAETMPTEKMHALVEAFRELPQRVLWKWEGKTLPGQPDNVRFDKWLPQRDILNHTNIRVFMTHCGLLGVTEATISGVPMVGIPIYGDQNANFRAVESVGVAVKLEYDSISKESVLTALRTVLQNPRYEENAKRLARQYQDRPTTAMDTAIFWTEYVIRHNGADQLRSAAVNLTWYQYLLLDVAFVIGTMIIIILCAIIFLVKKIAHLIQRKSIQPASNKRKQQ